ncbi:transposase [Neobacillus sp. 204]|uniref:transposase n=1 Tax=Neobacillus sp. 204 TaxID=3383351 RepID=UPI00397C3126
MQHWEAFKNKHGAKIRPIVVKIITGFFQKKAKVTPGIIAGLHTFGSRVNFNPHVHILVTMGGLTEKGEWKQYDFLPFAMLRKQWLLQTNPDEKPREVSATRSHFWNP